jgi:hypothetical protein
MPEKRPIDRHRDSGKSMEVGTPEEGAITEMISLRNTLFIVKERAIYTVNLADQIDPARSNINIPDIQQKFASEGSDSDRVCRIFLTARELFNKSYLAREFDCECGLTFCVRLLQDVLAMHEATVSLREAQEKASQSIKEGRGSLVLGAIPDAFVRAKSFIQKAEHATQTLYALCGFFFGKELEAKGKWFDGVSNLIKEKYGASDEFFTFAEKGARFCKFLRNARNCVEHENPNQRIIVNDYTLHASGDIRPPFIEIIHPETPEPAMPLFSFMEQMTQSVVNVTENFIAFLCAKHVQPITGFPVEVGLIPEEQRSNKMVRYGYVVWMGNQLVRAS